MSKVIKSCFIKKNKADINPFSLLDDYGAGHDAFPRETAYVVYEEAKILLQELVEESQQKAKKIIDDAEKKAKALKLAVATECEQIKENAYQEGFRQGSQRGRDSGAEEIKTLSLETKKLAQSLRQAQEKYLRDNEANIIDLVFAIAQKILGNVVELRPEMIKGLVKNVLEEVGKTEKLVIKVNPLHLPYLHTEELSAGALGQDKLSFMGDPEVKMGGCVLKTEGGLIDAQLEEQLFLLKKELKEKSGYAEFC